MGATLEVEGVTVMDLLQQHPAQDIQVHLAAEAVVVATLVEAEVVEATATALLLPRQALPTLHPRAPVQVLTQPQHRAQVPPMDLLLEGVAAYPATEEGVVVVVVVVVEEEGEDMVEVGGSLVLKCLRRAANKFPNKLQFRWNLMIYCFKESG